MLDLHLQLWRFQSTKHKSVLAAMVRIEYVQLQKKNLVPLEAMSCICMDSYLL